MCGRLNVSSGPLTLLFMDMVSQPYPGHDRHNMAPTEPVVVLRPTALGALEAATMRWWSSADRKAARTAPHSASEPSAAACMRRLVTPAVRRACRCSTAARSTRVRSRATRPSLPSPCPER